MEVPSAASRLPHLMLIASGPAYGGSPRSESQSFRSPASSAAVSAFPNEPGIDRKTTSPPSAIPVSLMDSPMSAAEEASVRILLWSGTLVAVLLRIQPAPTLPQLDLPGLWESEPSPRSVDRRTDGRSVPEVLHPSSRSPTPRCTPRRRSCQDTRDMRRYPAYWGTLALALVR